MLYTPKHAEQALEIVGRLLPHISPRPEYTELVAILDDPARWSEAHDLFSEIRANITLPVEDRKKRNLDSVFVYVAENAAKTAYNCSNCSGKPAPFDEDSFDWLLKCEKDFLEALESGVVAETNSEPQGVVSKGGGRGWFASLWTSLRRRG